MDFMKLCKKILRKYLSYSATIYVQSSPHFFMEAFIILVAFILTIFQHAQIVDYSRKILRLKAHTIYRKNDGVVDEDESMANIRKRANHTLTTVAYKRPSLNSSKSQLGWTGQLETVVDDDDKMRLSNEVLSLTPEQFVKIEKEKQLRQREFGGGQYSLSTLCQIAIKKQWSDSTFEEKLNALKENIECNSYSVEGKHLGNMTESLLCMLENLIKNSSVDNPLPFKGNITTLVLDAAELGTENQDLGKRDSKTDIHKNQDSVVLKTVNWADVVPQSEDVD